MSTLKDKLATPQADEAPRTASPPQPTNTEERRYVMIGHYEPRPRRIARDFLAIRQD